VHRVWHPPARLAVFISGGGRTLVNLQKAIEAGDLSATIPLVIASKQCPGVERAQARGLPVMIDRPRDVGRVEALLKEYRIDWVVLAGYLHLLPIPPAYAGRAVNIHPALLPDFGGHGMYGHKVHEAVLKAGRSTSGCTVHLCDDVYDRGEILLQLTCPVLPGDTPDTLADRVFVQECKAYPMALQQLIHARKTATDSGANERKHA
jgi:phosphoribosylglycinamide formyltransferase-1